jgi:hypothetical protein
VDAALAQMQRTVTEPHPARGPAPAPRLSAALGNRRFSQLVARMPQESRAALRGSSVAGAAVLARAVAARRGRLEGDGLNPEMYEELEGEGRRPVTAAPTRRLQRLTIKQVSLTKGDCGKREVKWIFSLDKAAAEDGYLVQHVDGSQDIAACPGPRSGTMTSTLDFWEAWPIKKGKKVHPRTDSLGRTDTSQRGETPGKTGLQVTKGEVKFFNQTTTGDLGDWDVAPAGTGSAWGPGKVPTSGRLPSTPTKPSWWDGTPVEGPAFREARSDWDCCDPDAKKHRSDVTAKPVPKAKSKWWQFWKWF